MGKDSLLAATILSEKLQRMSGSNLTAYVGTFSVDTALNALKVAAAQLVFTIGRGSSAAQTDRALVKLETTLQTAGVMGLLSDKELATYLGSCEEIYSLIDRSN